MQRARDAVDWLVTPEERAAARRRLDSLARDLAVVAGILVVLAGFLLGASLAFSFAVATLGGGWFVLGWVGMFVLAFGALLLAVRVAVELYTRLES